MCFKANKKIKRTVKSVTVFAEQKTAPLLTAAYLVVGEPLFLERTKAGVMNRVPIVLQRLYS